jgi:hypothetical protein
MATEQEIRNVLAYHTGSENFYKEPLSRCIYTDGFKEFMELCECAWLFTDSAIQISMDGKLKSEDFIVIKIKRDGEGANVTFEDGNYKALFKKRYSYTDFPLQEFSFYACRNEHGTHTFMLTTEY